ncbi:MAG: VanW family protein [Candidatus Curtissbacteria bacterium]|nr:VanW family protein [Candidatus Curtissbacteria bacterium]
MNIDLRQDKIRFFLILTVALILLGVFVYSFWRDRVLFNTYFAGENVSNKTRVEIEDSIESRLSGFKNKPVSFKIEDSNRVVDLTWEEIGVTFDYDKTTFEAVAAGKPKGLDDLFESLLFLFTKKDVAPSFEVDFDKLTQLESRLKSDAGADLALREVSNATIVPGQKGSVVKNGEGGRTIDSSKLNRDLAMALNSLDPDPIEVVIITTEPKVDFEGAQKALSKVNALSGQRITLKFQADLWTLSGSNFINILEFGPSGQEGGRFAGMNLGQEVTIVDLAIGSIGKRELDVGVNQEQLDKFVGGIASSVNKETVDATLSFDGERVQNFIPAQDGQALDEVETKRLLLSHVSTQSNVTDKEIVIDLPVLVTRAKIASDEINTLGIKELVGRGVSYYSGSIANRIYNLSLGASRASGTIVKPGESFSFNKAVGEVSGATGYKPAYVISGGRTVLDDGGGICQVSTTIFRAALNSGLPITARTAHAYRVGYYEQRGFKPGLDATVWSPAVDLIFKNDTKHHILVQAIVDPSNARLQVDIYGTSDGRTVELGEPVVTNIRPAPEPKYQDDPSLLKGTVKQVDFAAPGANSVFTRKVFRGGETITDESFKSNYRPWQAVYLVGTGT